MISKILCQFCAMTLCWLIFYFIGFEIPSLILLGVSQISFILFIFAMIKFCNWKISSEVKNETIKRKIEFAVYRSKNSYFNNMFVFWIVGLLISLFYHNINAATILFVMQLCISTYNLIALDKLNKDINELN